MTEINEVQTLTTPKGVYNSFPDLTARAEIEKLKQGGAGNGSGQNVNQMDVFGGYDRFYDSIARMQVNPTAPLDIQTYDGSNKPTHPKVLYFADGWAGHKYWLTYSPFPNNNNTYENPCIEYSDDGVNFTGAGIANPIEDTPMENGVKVGYNSDPHLVEVNGVMECWWRTHFQSGTNANHEVIFRKTSTDGINWGAKEELFRVLDGSAGSLLSPTAIYEDGIYKIWVVYKQQVMRYYESADGTDWTHIRDVNVDNPDYPTYKVWHIDVIHTANGYEFVGCYHPTNDFNDNRYVYYAVSQDNVTYSDRVLILTNGKPGNFDATELYRPTILREANKVRIYYGCRNVFGDWKIGMIEAPTPYLFNAVLRNGLRLDALESRLAALESGSGGSGGSGGSDNPGDSGGGGNVEDMDIAESFADSDWMFGYYGNDGQIVTEMQMHRTQLMPTGKLIVRAAENGKYLRVSYFDAAKNYLGFDTGAGIGQNVPNANPDIVVNASAGAYFAVSYNSDDKANVTVEPHTGMFATDATPIARYTGENHGSNDGEWQEIGGGASATVNGGTWNDDGISMDGADDYLVVHLVGAKTVVVRAKIMSDYSATNKPAYLFDCRQTTPAYMLNYNRADYIGTSAAVYTDQRQMMKNASDFSNKVALGEWHYFTIVFDTAFTGDMVLFSHNDAPTDCAMAEASEITVYDVDITTW